MPPVWISDVDATDPAAGIHCGPVPPGFGLVARRALKLLKGLEP